MKTLAVVALLLSTPGRAEPSEEDEPGGQVRRDDQELIGPGELCEYGGLKRYYWFDTNADDERQDDEVDEVRLYCRTDYRSEKALRKKAWREDDVAHGKWVVTGAEELEALEGVVVFDGSLVVEGSDLERLDGLDGLVSVDGSLVFEDNPALVEIPAFPALERVSGELVVSGNPAVERLDAFHALVEVGGVRIEDTPLRRVKAFEGLASLESLVLGQLPRLDELPDLSGLVVVEEEVKISEVGLEALDLPALERVGSLEVSTCPELARLDLPALEATEELVLSDLSALAEVDLSGLEEAGAVRVAAVPVLSELVLPALRAIDGDLVVEDGVKLEEVHLDALTTVGGGVRLQALHGSELAMSSLTTVEGSLVLTELKMLGGLDSLAALERVGDGLELVSLPALADVEGLGTLREIGSVLRVEKVGISTLQLDGLEQLLGMDVYANRHLKSVVGFDAPTRVEGEIRIRGNESLAEVRGFQALVEAERFSVDGNEELEVVEGLGALARVGALEFAGSDELVQVPAFESLADADLIRFAYVGSLSVLPAFPALERGGFDIENVDLLKALPEWGAVRELTRLRLVGNDILKGLPALPALETVTGDVYVSGQPKLRGWGSLASTLRIDGGLYVEDQKKVPSFEALQSVGGDLVVVGEVGLSGSCFPSLQQVGALGFQGWSGKSMPRFGALARVERDLVLADNAALVSLDGLTTLGQVGGGVTVARNLVLEDVTGLFGLDEVGGRVVFVDNSRQCASSIDAFKEATGHRAFGQGLDDGC